jgi:hypothetical protein
LEICFAYLAPSSPSGRSPPFWVAAGDIIGKRVNCGILGWLWQCNDQTTLGRRLIGWGYFNISVTQAVSLKDK